jgi:hypothetical protein
VGKATKLAAPVEQKDSAVPILVEQNPGRGRWIGVTVMAAFIALGYVAARPAPPHAMFDTTPAADDTRSFSDVAAPEPAVPAAEPEPAPR